MTLRTLILLVMACLITGCATVNRGSSDHFRIDSVPQGATAITSIETSKSKRARAKDKNQAPVYKSCTPTPCAIKIQRLSEFTVRLEHENYETVEMFVTNSTRRSSLATNTAAALTVAGTTGTAAGTAAVAAGITAATAGTLAAAGTGFAAGAGAGLTFGLVSVETAVTAGAQAGFNAGVATAPSTSSAIGAAIPPALALSAGMLLIDAGNGANRNLYPNPVVLVLAPKGTPVRTDPLVALFKDKQTAQTHADEACSIIQKKHTLKYRQACSQAKVNLKEKKAVLKTARKSQIRQATIP
ncbi:MAG: hypothetical protein ABJG88_03910 [Litorimonas sp.]